MEPRSASNCSSGRSSKHHLLPGSSSSFQGESDMVEVSCSDSNSSQQKRQRNALPHEVIEISEDDKPAVAVIIGENTSDYKNKQPMEYDMDCEKQNDALSNTGSSTNRGLETDAAVGNLKSSEPDSVDSNHSDDEYDDNDYYDDDGYDYDVELIDNDCDYNLSAKFDDMDLPPGVEATVPWLQKSEPGKEISIGKDMEKKDEIDTKFRSFKQFDTIQDYSDHHYADKKYAVKKPMKDWVKKIQQEWKVLEKDLPETIFVRVYEDRLDLLRAVIIGPSGTPYHDGLFFFDFHFSNNYPSSPPTAYYHSGGLRINPNLYNCGKVCLSLLNTWSGSGCEKWDPRKSTMLQVLVSIQALVLNAKPYFNEPGYANSANTPSGEDHSFTYNENVFLLSCKTMLYSLRRPPKAFEDFVAGHFCKHGHTILAACRSYLDGAQVGCLVKDGVRNLHAGDRSCSPGFKETLKKLFEELLMEFAVKGADCKIFFAQKIKAGAAACSSANAADNAVRV